MIHPFACTFSGASSCLTRDLGLGTLLTTLGFVSNEQFAGGCTKVAEKVPEEVFWEVALVANELQLLQVSCKWFIMHVGLSFLSMSTCVGPRSGPSGHLHTAE